jgi:hypothetical protein
METKKKNAVDPKKRKIKEVDPYSTKQTQYREPNPEQYKVGKNVGKKLKKVLKDILKE